MNILLRALLPALLCLLAVLPTPAARTAASYDEAKPHLTEDGCIFFAHAEGWDHFSQKRCDALMAAKDIRRAAGNAVLIPLPIAEFADDARKQKQKKYCGELTVPGARSYPALIFFDARGRHYATLCGAVVTRGGSAEISRRITELMAAGRERVRLLDEAERAQGPAKASLIFKAYQIEGLSGSAWQQRDELAKLDPDDISGTVRSARFNPYDFAYKLERKPLKEAVPEVERMLADHAYTPLQKQRICAALIGTLRRRGTPEEKAAISLYAERMHELDPDSREGKTAGYVLSQWLHRPGLHYHEGWTPDNIRLDATPVEVQGIPPMKEPGQYSVTFTYTAGAYALLITSVALYDGDTKVAEDRHDGKAGHAHSDNTYHLKVDRELSRPRLFITTRMNETNSRGYITITRP